MDLAEGHVAAFNYIKKNVGIETINLGTGVPFSVLEMVRAFEAVTGQVMPVQLGGRRTGDLPVYFASVNKAKELMSWEAKRSLTDMCESAWNFQVKHLATPLEVS